MRRLYSITCANAGWCGNNPRMASAAIVNDGLLQLAILEASRRRNVPHLAWRLLNETIHQSSFVETLTAREFEIGGRALARAIASMNHTAWQAVS